jgi:thiol-disulfide isomerase/thioredoxin
MSILRPQLFLLLAASTFLAAPLSAQAAGTREKAAAPEVISNGKKVRLEDYLVPGKTTIFEFYSPFCPTCKAIAPDMDKLHATRDDLAVVKVNINRPGAKGIDWDSPVSLQYKLEGTPRMKVYGPDGKLVAEGRPAYDLVTGWFK